MSTTKSFMPRSSKHTWEARNILASTRRCLVINEECQIQKVSCQEAQNMLEKLEIFLLQQEGVHIGELLCTLSSKMW